MKTIIVATDFSAEAENASIYAATAAQQLGVRIILFSLQNVSIHALNSRLPGSTFDHIIIQCYEMVAEAAQKLVHKYKIEVVPDLATGDFYEEIERCQAKYRAELVVLGMPQKSLEQDLLGNTTTKAIDRLSIPVLAVPLTASYREIKKILFACDVMRGVQTKVLLQVRELAKLLGAEVEVFHVQNQVQALQEMELEENFELIRHELSGIRYVYKGVASNKIVAAIRSELLASNTDLLIMLTHRYGFWNSLVHRSKTREMAAGASVPLLSLPIKPGGA
ncbi:universal stress protein [Pedobacter sp. GR22-6]|uniref:universal stress protein n=1 Tax=Pedobacter sp. GR22-6 TaxID=3127957 RepID=UPI00307CD945